MTHTSQSKLKNKLGLTLLKKALILMVMSRLSLLRKNLMAIYISNGSWNQVVIVKKDNKMLMLFEWSQYRI